MPALADKYERAAQQVARQPCVLFRRDERQPRPNPQPRSARGLRHQGVHGRIDRQHARRQSGDARRHLSRRTGADRDALRGHADDRGEPRHRAREVRRRDSGRAPSVHPLARSLHQVDAPRDRTRPPPRLRACTCCTSSTADELQLFAPGPPDGKRITAETCVHFLHFSEVDYAQKGNLIKCNPADQVAGRPRGDHRRADRRPHSTSSRPITRRTRWEEKQQPYEKAPSGLPLVQFGAAVRARTLVRRPVAARTDRREDRARPCPPVQREGARLHPRRLLGRSRADRPEQAARSDARRDVLSKCGWSPFEGTRFRSTVDATWVNGHLAWHEGKLDDSRLGRRLEFDR